MSKKILAFGASNSKKSINQALALHAASHLDGEIVSLHLNDFEMPIYGIDKENEDGIPDLAYSFKKRIDEVDGLIISFAEHNGSFTSAFKNIFDWISRIDKGILKSKKMIIMSAAPGAAGGKRVLDHAEIIFSYNNENYLGSFSLSHFSENFSEKQGIVNNEKKKELFELLSVFEKSL